MSCLRAIGGGRDAQAGGRPGGESLGRGVAGQAPGAAGGLGADRRAVARRGLRAPIGAHWDREAQTRGRSARRHGRPTIAIQTYVRLLVLKHRYGWGYETLMREVSDEAAAKKLLRLMDALEENDDVQGVYANFDIPERVLEAVAS